MLFGSISGFKPTVRFISWFNPNYIGENMIDLETAFEWEKIGEAKVAICLKCGKMTLVITKDPYSQVEFETCLNCGYRKETYYGQDDP